MEIADADSVVLFREHRRYECKWILLDCFDSTEHFIRLYCVEFTIMVDLRELTKLAKSDCMRC